MTSPPTAIPPESPRLPTGDHLAPADGHRVWWCGGGVAEAPAVLIVHGGPGGASRIEPAGWFAGLALRWLAIDQRGCGRSLPLGATDGNRLPDLLADMERLREQLGLQQWALAGGSWGARVALAYAAQYPDRVTGLFLRSPFLGSLPETRRYIAPWRDWLGAEGEAWLGEELSSLVHSVYHQSTHSFVDGTQSGNPNGLLQAAVTRAWAAFDDAQSAPGGALARGGRWSASMLPEATAGLRASWAVHAHLALSAWGAADGIPVGTLQPALPPGTPVRIVWGREDATCDPAVAQALGQALAEAGMAVSSQEVAGAGHRMSDPQLAPALAAAARAWVADLQRAGTGRHLQHPPRAPRKP